MWKEQTRYCIDVYVKRPRIFMWKYEFKRIGNKKKYHYYQTKLTRRKKEKLLRKLNRRQIRYRCYEERWGRSSDYRKNFLNAYEKPYRCRYCNRRLTEETMVIDHIIPVGAVKKDIKHARAYLNMQGMETVNDVRNLAASCQRCNASKRDKMGIWLFRAWIGKFRIYWLIRFVVRLVLFCFLVLVILYLLQIC